MSKGKASQIRNGLGGGGGGRAHPYPLPHPPAPAHPQQQQQPQPQIQQYQHSSGLRNMSVEQRPGGEPGASSRATRERSTSSGASELNGTQSNNNSKRHLSCEK